MAARPLMIQGTMSNVGKSIIAAGLCRIFTQDGYDVSPFKSQNMALNSFITDDGGEMGRAQVVQAEACGKKPTVAMNPILLKPVTDQGSQVIVNGRARATMTASEYFATRQSLLPEIRAAYNSLETISDIVVIEGAGSPAEINLREGDIVNMGLAGLVDAPVLLVGDIDRGGVFAQLVGTCDLLPEAERMRIRGFILNKFRGDVALLSGGLDQLTGLTGIPTLGVVPYLDLDIDDEDSLSERLFTHSRATQGTRDVAVVRLPKVSNFTDFTVLGSLAGLSLRYVDGPGQLGTPDLLILPGTRNTIADLAWLRRCGLSERIVEYARTGGAILGICGGYQMLGRIISDPDHVEGGGTVPGLGLLPVATSFRPSKHQTHTSGVVRAIQGPLAGLSGSEIEGYEIHMGETVLDKGASPFLDVPGGTDGCWSDNVYGTYLHGFFDSVSARRGLVRVFGLSAQILDYTQYRQDQYDKLADALRRSLNMDEIYRIIGICGSSGLPRRDPTPPYSDGNPSGISHPPSVGYPPDGRGRSAQEIPFDQVQTVIPQDSPVVPPESGSPHPLVILTESGSPAADRLPDHSAIVPGPLSDPLVTRPKTGSPCAGLASRPHVILPKPGSPGADLAPGLVHLYTGEGKGKTTAALGLALRAAGRGRHVLIVQFLKGRDSGEVHSLEQVPGIDVVRLSKDYGFAKSMSAEDLVEVRREHDEMLIHVQQAMSSSDYGMIVLDEIAPAVQHGLVDWEKLTDLIDDRPAGMEIVMTGRNAPESLVQRADYITEMHKIKHPFDRGVTARKGIEW